MVSYEEFGEGMEIPNEPPVKDNAPQVVEKISKPSPRERETNILISNSTTADDLLNQEKEGTLVNTTDGANIVGFFEPLEPIEQAEGI